ncbi:hypothetical protein [Lampropedia aestuarii]|uniref:hypothetical protein n=1 Tax=Lampropedia aestuarii TaxID=2562762 RepID=UPI00246829E4|nr:hypothetical protein [Lampropedia aestuarii]MDH5857677.1 hypothetical protein [Lampropedia aestuarii]
MILKKPLATVWWINAALLGALVLWWLSVLRSDWQPPAPLIPDYSAVLDGALLPGQLTAKEYTNTIERPIFEVDRTWPKPAPKPEEKPAEAVTEEVPKNALDGVVLQGIYDQSGSGMAIFSAEGKSHRLKVGEEYEEWTMTDITPLSAHFSHPTQGEKTLTIKRSFELEKSDKNTEPTAPPAASNTRTQGSSLLTPQQNRQPTNQRSAPPAQPATPTASEAPPAANARPPSRAVIGGSSRPPASTQ